MIIEYEHPQIVTDIEDAIADGHNKGRPVKRIKLNQLEWANFYRWASETNPEWIPGQRSCLYRGVTITQQ